jgi:predicted transglutaminase-like cysteine proteinase
MMKKADFFTTGCLAASLMALSADHPAQALPSTQTLSKLAVVTLKTGAVPARPVTAWIDFCDKNSAECAVNLAEPEEVPFSEELMQTLTRVNLEVNKSLAPLTDMEHWGIADQWGLPTDGKGDCEDYQLLKRTLLIAHGLPRRSLRMTVVLDEKHEGHAVLMVRTDQGDLILDNKTNLILSWEETDYIYVKRESAFETGWVSLGGVIPPLTSANKTSARASLKR